MDEENQELGEGEAKELPTVPLESPRPAPRRSLKFRAYDTVKGWWITGGYGFHILGEALLMGGLFSEYGVMELNNIAITQYTGLHDKDGREIYEGDILKHHKYGGFHAVAWVPESTGFFVGKEAWPLTKLCTPNIEVIGNIFETARTTSAASGHSIVSTESSLPASA